MAIHQSAFNVGLAKKTDFVAGLVQKLGEEGEVMRDRPISAAMFRLGRFVAGGVYGMRIQSRQHAGAGWQAKRIGCERVSEGHAFPRNSVHVRRMNHRIARAA